MTAQFLPLVMSCNYNAKFVDFDDFVDINNFLFPLQILVLLVKIFWFLLTCKTLMTMIYEYYFFKFFILIYLLCRADRNGFSGCSIPRLPCLFSTTFLKIVAEVFYDHVTATGL